MKTVKTLILFSILITASTGLFAQSAMVKQRAMVSDINSSTDYFGKPGTTIISQKIARDSNTNQLFFKTHFRKDRHKIDGKTYYDVEFKVEFAFKDIIKVYDKNNGIYMEFNNDGFIMAIKGKHERRWDSYRKYNSDFYIVIEDPGRRAHFLGHFKFLKDHPKAINN